MKPSRTTSLGSKTTMGKFLKPLECNAFEKVSYKGVF